MQKDREISSIEYGKIDGNTPMTRVQGEPFNPPYAKVFGSIREKEKLGLTDVSEGTGISIDILERVEASAVDYSIEDFEKLLAYYCGFGYSITVSF
jgi:hypothetical protein